MTIAMRNSAMDVVGEIASGTHCCVFYDTRADLLDTLVTYCKGGLQAGEFCLWVIAAPITKDDAVRALRRVMPDIDSYIARGSIEFVTARSWYLDDDTFDLERVIAGWKTTLARALAGGYAGVRVTGDTAWLEKKAWKNFCDYEASLNDAIANQRLAVLCTYPIQACGAGEVLDVVQTHQFAIAKRRGHWDVIETAGHQQAKREIERLNRELEERVAERTRQLTSVNRELTSEVRQRQRAEDALRRSEAYLAEAQRLSHTGSWAFNRERSIYWSEENFRIWGFEPQQELPSRQAVVERVHPEDRARVLECALNAIRDRTDYVVEFRVMRPDGILRHVQGSGHPVFDPHGELVEVVGTLVDITERKRAEHEREKLHQLQADLARVNRVTTMGESTGSLAHEIRQPIAAAMTNAKTCLRWLGRADPDVEEGRLAAARVVKDVTRAADIITSISELFKKGAVPRELVDVNELIGEMIRLLRSEATRYAVSMRSALDPHLPAVVGERVQLQQVLMNLMLNGIEAMKDTRGANELTIRSEAQPSRVLISVSDTGAGLGAEHGDQIFKAFFTTKDHGTGMGLPISRSIVESHGGHLWATGNAAQGATFQFSLPATTAAHV